jgi:hypothetical protein
LGEGGEGEEGGEDEAHVYSIAEKKEVGVRRAGARTVSCAPAALKALGATVSLRRRRRQEV